MIYLLATSLSLFPYKTQKSQRSSTFSEIFFLLSAAGTLCLVTIEKNRKTVMFSIGFAIFERI